MIICNTLQRFSHQPKDIMLVTMEIEYGTEATGDVPSPAFVEKATPSDATNKPIRNRAYRPSYSFILFWGIRSPLQISINFFINNERFMTAGVAEQVREIFFPFLIIQ